MCRDCIGAAGEASGKLVEVDRIEAGAVEQGNEPVVLLVKQASGDEEVGACGVNLRGVILCHGLPHLSHLGLPLRSLTSLKNPLLSGLLCHQPMSWAQLTAEPLTALPGVLCVAPSS